MFVKPYYSDYPFDKNLEYFCMIPILLSIEIPKKIRTFKCIDVMEHIQKREIEDPLIKMDNYSNKNLYFSFVLDQQKNSTRWSKCSCHFTRKQAWRQLKKNISQEKKIY